MGAEAIIVIFKESGIFLFRLLPYLLAGLFVGAVLEVALSRYGEIRRSRLPGARSYLLVSLVDIGTPL